MAIIINLKKKLGNLVAFVLYLTYTWVNKSKYGTRTEEGKEKCKDSSGKACIYSILSLRKHIS
jgi:hypothetical protein